MNDRTNALFLIISGSIIGGAISTVTKIGLASIEPFSFAFLRFALGSLVVIPWFLKEKVRIDKRPIKIIDDFIVAGNKYCIFCCWSQIYNGINWTNALCRSSNVNCHIRFVDSRGKDFTQKVVLYFFRTIRSFYNHISSNIGKRTNLCWRFKR